MAEIFKEVSEVEEFFKNLGIEYRFSCYYEKNAEGIAQMKLCIKQVVTHDLLNKLRMSFVGRLYVDYSKRFEAIVQSI